MVNDGTTGTILYAGRELEDAVDGGSPEEIRAGAEALLRAATAREGRPATAGFEATDPLADPSTDPATGQRALRAALTELEVASVLLAGSAAAEDAASLEDLSDALDRLQVEDGGAVTAGLFGRASDAKPFAEQVTATLDGVVDRTTAVARSVVTGLATIPAADAKRILGGVVTALPEVGALAAAGLRALRRAWAALAALVPAQVADLATGWARDWWEGGADPVFDGVTRRALSVDSLTPLVEAASASTDTARLDAAAARLADLDARHADSIGVVDRVVAVLSRITGPLALAISAAATWILVAGGSALLLALGAAIWIGRDHLDTGSVVDRTPGVRSILTGVTA